MLAVTYQRDSVRGTNLLYIATARKRDGQFSKLGSLLEVLSMQVPPSFGFIKKGR